MRCFKTLVVLLLLVFSTGAFAQKKEVKRGHSDPAHFVFEKAQKARAAALRADTTYNIADHYTLTNSELTNWIKSVPSSVHEGHYFNVPKDKGKVLYSSHNLYIIGNEIIRLIGNWNGDTSDAAVNPIAQLFKFYRGSQYVLYGIYGADTPLASWAKNKYKEATLAVINKTSLYSFSSDAAANEGRCTILSQAYMAGGSLMGMQDKFIGEGMRKLSYFTPSMMKSHRCIAQVFTNILVLNYNGFDQVGTSILNMANTDATRAYYCVTDMVSWFNNNFSQCAGSSIEYQLTDLVRESCRYMSSENSTLYSWIKSYIKSMVQTSAGSTHHRTWAQLCGSISYYKSGDLAYFGIPSNWQSTVIDKVFGNMKVYPAIEAKLCAQDLSNSDMDAIAAMLGRTKQLFHQHTGIASNNPVPGDVNQPVNLYIFRNYSDFKYYSSLLFRIYNPAGGMYIEGDPTDSTAPYSILYDVKTSSTEYGIWNATHEFTHYLDGRYIKKGTYSDETQNINVCYTEGLANFIAFTQGEGSYPGSFQASYTWIKSKNMKLSELLSTPRDPWDSEKIYDGGPVAVKFLMEQKPQKFNQIVTLLRAGDFAGLENYLVNTIGTSEDAAFTAWVNAQ